MKYIVLRAAGREFPVIFPNDFVHADVATALRESCDMLAKAEVVSAGETSSMNVAPGCVGKSSTLGVPSRGRADDDLIRMHDYLHGITW